MSLKMDPEIALEVIEKYLQEVQDLLKLNYKEGSERKSELNSKIRAFIRTAFEDSDERLRGYITGPLIVDLGHVESENEKQNGYTWSLTKMNNYLISFKEEITLILASKKRTEFMKKKEPLSELKPNNINLKEISNDLQILIESCENDLDNDKNIDVSWTVYVKEYNNIILKLHEIGLFKSFELISDELDAEYLTPVLPYQIAKIREIITNSKKLKYRIQGDTTKSNERNVNDLMQVFSRFHLVVNQLKKKHQSRNTLTVENEYDVQYLIHPLLKIFFDDIRPEESTPSYAGGSTKIDFLLKQEKIAIEIKMTRPNLKNTELRKQLNDDIRTYKKHDDCETLIIFIYDPESIVSNPNGFIKDFNDQATDDFKVIVYISP